MSKFDFAKLREQVKKTSESLKETFKGTDNQIYGNLNRPLGWRENVAEANRKKHSDPIIKEKMAQANRDKRNRLGEEFSKKLSESQKKRYANMSSEEKELLSKKTKEIWNDTDFRKKMEEFYNSDEYKKYITERNQKMSKDPDWRKKTAENNRNKRNDPDHILKHTNSVKNRSTENIEWIRKNCRPVKCPYGIFDRASKAMDAYHREFGGNRQSVGVKLRSWLNNKKKTDWNYITWEEYDKLTQD